MDKTEANLSSGDEWTTVDELKIEFEEEDSNGEEGRRSRDSLKIELEEGVSPVDKIGVTVKGTLSSDEEEIKKDEIKLQLESYIVACSPTDVTESSTSDEDNISIELEVVQSTDST